MALLAPGDLAPEFTLVDQHLDPLSLSSLRGRTVLLFFFLEAGTPDCTVQACGLRDVAPELAEVADIAVIGVSPDPPERQAAFDAEHRLGFPLLSDPDHQVAEAYGVWDPAARSVVRSALLIGEGGVVERVWVPVPARETAMQLVLALTGEE